jgi:hypothetical protein
MPSWREIVAQRSSHPSAGHVSPEQVRAAERSLREAGQGATHSPVPQDQSARLRAWSADRDGLSPEAAADLDRVRSREMWAHRYGIPVEGSPVQAAGPESLREAEKALSEKLGYDVDLRNMPKPGTPEFVARYCQPPEPIERIQPRADGAEGWEYVKCDVDGNPLGGKGVVEPLETPGPGPERGTPGYDVYDHTPKPT